MAISYITRSGTPLNFDLTPIGMRLPEHSGIYMHASCANNIWAPTYVGQAKCIQDRYWSHEQIDNSKRLGATHILTAHVPRQEDRDRIEAELIRELQPPLNIQLR